MHAMIDLTEVDDVATRTTSGASDDAPLRPHHRDHRAPVTEVGILTYQAAWDAGFRAEAESLERVFAPLLPFIEHVGTTAVRGSAARPIIDIAVGVAKPAAVQFMVETLRGHGYALSEHPEPNFGQQLFVRSQRGLPTHHVHVVEYQGTTWKQLLHFRDVLRADTRLAREYEWLRRRFAGLHPANRVAYVRAKVTFITSIVNAVR